MFGKAFQRKYALTEQGVKNIKKGVWWTVVVDLVVMGGISILYLLMRDWMAYWLEDEPMPSFTVYFWMTVLFLVLSLATHYQQYRATYGLVYGEVRNVRIRLAESMRKLPLHFFAKRDLADLSETVMSDVNRLEHVWSHVLGYLYGSFISTTIIAVGLFLQDVHLAIACLWGVPVAFTLLFSSRVLAKRLSEEGKKAALHVSDTMQDMLENVREIRANCQEVSFLQRFFFAVDGQEKITRKGEFVVGIFVNAASVIMRLGVATTILVGASRIASGKISFMTLFLFMLVISRVYAPFDQSLALIAELFISRISAERLMEIEDTPVAQGSEAFPSHRHDITFSHVSFRYEQEEVLHDVCFTAPEGKVTALIGPSGSGKSTCVRLAARLWDADEGTVAVGGINVTSIDPEVLLSDFSMVFQEVMLFDDTVMENIRLGRRGANDAEVIAAAKAANCDTFVERLPQGYDTPIGENGTRLSGGERQRISIARALLKNAPIVLLDEATASLDVENETQVQEALSHLLVNKTVLVIAHRMRTIEAADYIVVFDRGKVRETGSPSALLADENSFFSRMSRLQRRSAEWKA